MGSTGLTLVASDRIDDFDATCAAAGFDGQAARRFSALYAGPSRSERRIARAFGSRLWLPVSLEPLLTGSRFGFDDEPGPDAGAADGEAGCSAGSAALELLRGQRGSHVAVVMKAVFVERIADDLQRLLPAYVASPEVAGGSVRALELELPDEAAKSGACSPPGWSHAGGQAITAFLSERGADRIAHPGGALSDHLGRTAALLASWRARPALIMAGHCHAAYGTDGFAPALLTTGERIALAQLIGVEAEAIVHAYAACTRSAGYPSLARPSLRDRWTGATVALAPQLVRDLAELACANELDVLRHAADLSGEQRRSVTNLLSELRPLLGQRAALAIGATLAAEASAASGAAHAGNER